MDGLDDIDELEFLGRFFPSPHKHTIADEINSKNYTPCKKQSTVHRIIGKKLNLDERVKRGIITPEEAERSAQISWVTDTEEEEEEEEVEEQEEEEDDIEQPGGMDMNDNWPSHLDRRLQQYHSSPPRVTGSSGPLSELHSNVEDEGELMEAHLDPELDWNNQVVTGGSLARGKDSSTSNRSNDSRAVSIPTSRRTRFRIQDHPQGKRWSRFHEILRLEFVGRTPARGKEIRSEDSQESMFIRDVYHQFFGRNAPPMTPLELIGVVPYSNPLIGSVIKCIAVLGHEFVYGSFNIMAWQHTNCLRVPVKSELVYKTPGGWQSTS